MIPTAVIGLSRRLSQLPPKGKIIIMVASDAVCLPLCMLLAVALRLGSLQGALATAPMVQVALALLSLPVLARAGLYSTVVRYIDLRVVGAASGALALGVGLVYVGAVLLQFTALPRSSMLIFWFISLAYVVSSRFIARTLLRRGLDHRRMRLRTAIYGAGEAGAQLAKAMQFSVDYKAVCFVDDRRALNNKNISGLRVYAPSRLEEAVIRHDVAQFVVAIPSASAQQLSRVVTMLQPTGLPVKILSSKLGVGDGLAPGVDTIREVDVADLLGRDPVAPAPDLFARDLADKVVMVTGAGGSIGSELCRQIVTQRPRCLLLLDHSEYALYEIERELGRSGVKTVPCLGSVTDAVMLEHLMRDHGVQTVYHAAAYKHVPIVESNVQQGLVNNVFGTLAVARAAEAAGVATCVLVSTDKAVRPTNVMGATKRVAELVFQAAALRARQTVYAMVRFGNVLGSSGSVVPLFRQQIRAGGPITITHPEIIRYFMLIPEAAQLVIQAGAMARGGEVFVLDMGEPVRIIDLARSMIRLSGLTEKTAQQPDGDIEIRAVGLRPGEKLFEELLIGDNVVPSMHPRILCAHERHIDPALLDKMLDTLRQACDAHDSTGMLRQLRNLVPEFLPAEQVNALAERRMAERCAVASADTGLSSAEPVAAAAGRD